MALSPIAMCYQPWSTPLCSLSLRCFLCDVCEQSSKGSRSFSPGLWRQGFGYKGSSFHRIIPGFFCQGSNFTHYGDIGGKSTYGEKYQGGSFILKHPGSGILSMENAGPNTNGCSFFAYTAKPEWLDGQPRFLGE